MVESARLRTFYSTETLTPTRESALVFVEIDTVDGPVPHPFSLYTVTARFVADAVRRLDIYCVGRRSSPLVAMRSLETRSVRFMLEASAPEIARSLQEPPSPVLRRWDADRILNRLGRRPRVGTIGGAPFAAEVAEDPAADIVTVAVGRRRLIGTQPVALRFATPAYVERELSQRPFVAFGPWPPVVFVVRLDAERLDAAVARLDLDLCAAPIPK